MRCLTPVHCGLNAGGFILPSREVSCVSKPEAPGEEKDEPFRTGGESLTVSLCSAVSAPRISALLKEQVSRSSTQSKDTSQSTTVRKANDINWKFTKDSTNSQELNCSNDQSRELPRPSSGDCVKSPVLLTSESNTYQPSSANEYNFQRRASENEVTEVDIASWIFNTQRSTFSEEHLNWPPAGTSQSASAPRTVQRETETAPAAYTSAFYQRAGIRIEHPPSPVGLPQYVGTRSTGINQIAGSISPVIIQIPGDPQRQHRRSVQKGMDNEKEPSPIAMPASTDEPVATQDTVGDSVKHTSEERDLRQFTVIPRERHWQQQKPDKPRTTSKAPWHKQRTEKVQQVTVNKKKLLQPLKVSKERPVLKLIGNQRHPPSVPLVHRDQKTHSASKPPNRKPVIEPTPSSASAKSETSVPDLKVGKKRNFTISYMNKPKAIVRPEGPPKGQPADTSPTHLTSVTSAVKQKAPNPVAVRVRSPTERPPVKAAEIDGPKSGSQPVSAKGESSLTSPVKQPQEPPVRKVETITKREVTVVQKPALEVIKLPEIQGKSKLAVSQKQVIQKKDTSKQVNKTVEAPQKPLILPPVKENKPKVEATVPINEHTEKKVVLPNEKDRRETPVKKPVRIEKQPEKTIIPEQKQIPNRVNVKEAKVELVQKQPEKVQPEVTITPNLAKSGIAKESREQKEKVGTTSPQVIVSEAQKEHDLVKDISSSTNQPSKEDKQKKVQKSLFGALTSRSSKTKNKEKTEEPELENPHTLPESGIVRDSGEPEKKEAKPSPQVITGDEKKEANLVIDVPSTDKLPTKVDEQKKVQKSLFGGLNTRASKTKNKEKTEEPELENPHTLPESGIVRDSGEPEKKEAKPSPQVITGDEKKEANLVIDVPSTDKLPTKVDEQKKVQKSLFGGLNTRASKTKNKDKPPPDPTVDDAQVENDVQIAEKPKKEIKPSLKKTKADKKSANATEEKTNITDDKVKEPINLAEDDESDKLIIEYRHHNIHLQYAEERKAETMVAVIEEIDISDEREAELPQEEVKPTDLPPSVKPKGFKRKVIEQLTTQTMPKPMQPSPPIQKVASPKKGKTGTSTQIPSAPVKSDASGGHAPIMINVDRSTPHESLSGVPKSENHPALSDSKIVRDSGEPEKKEAKPSPQVITGDETKEANLVIDVPSTDKLPTKVDEQKKVQKSLFGGLNTRASKTKNKDKPPPDPTVDDAQVENDVQIAEKPKKEIKPSLKKTKADKKSANATEEKTNITDDKVKEPINLAEDDESDKLIIEYRHHNIHLQYAEERKAETMVAVIEEIDISDEREAELPQEEVKPTDLPPSVKPKGFKRKVIEQLTTYTMPKPMQPSPPIQKVASPKKGKTGTSTQIPSAPVKSDASGGHAPIMINVDRSTPHESLSGVPKSENHPALSDSKIVRDSGEPEKKEAKPSPQVITGDETKEANLVIDVPSTDKLPTKVDEQKKVQKSLFGGLNTRASKTKNKDKPPPDPTVDDAQVENDVQIAEKPKKEIKPSLKKTKADKKSANATEEKTNITDDKVKEPINLAEDDESDKLIIEYRHHNIHLQYAEERKAETMVAVIEEIDISDEREAELPQEEVKPTDLPPSVKPKGFKRKVIEQLTTQTMPKPMQPSPPIQKVASPKKGKTGTSTQIPSAPVKSDASGGHAPIMINVDRSIPHESLSGVPESENHPALSESGIVRDSGEPEKKEAKPSPQMITGDEKKEANLVIDVPSTDKLPTKVDEQKKVQKSLFGGLNTRASKTKNKDKPPPDPTVDDAQVENDVQIAEKPKKEIKPSLKKTKADKKSANATEEKTNITDDKVKEPINLAEDDESDKLIIEYRHHNIHLQYAEERKAETMVAVIEEIDISDEREAELPQEEVKPTDLPPSVKPKGFKRKVIEQLTTYTMPKPMQPSPPIQKVASPKKGKTGTSIQIPSTPVKSGGRASIMINVDQFARYDTLFGISSRTSSLGDTHDPSHITTGNEEGKTEDIDEEMSASEPLEVFSNPFHDGLKPVNPSAIRASRYRASSMFLRSSLFVASTYADDSSEEEFNDVFHCDKTYALPPY